MGRMLQLLGMSFQSLHMSFASFVRLASMIFMLKSEASQALKAIYDFVLRKLKRIFSSRQQNLYADAWESCQPQQQRSSQSWLLAILALGASALILKSLYSWIFQAKSQKKKLEESLASLSADKDLVRALTHREVLHMVNEVMQRRKPQSSNEFAVNLLQTCTKPLQKLARSPQLLQALSTADVQGALSDIGAGREPNMSYRTKKWIIRCAELKQEGKDVAEEATQQNSNTMMNMGMMGGMGMGMGMG
mmetsp:Transcript_17749/g.28354  ORF Transcript_17749/g.28354 Transcript_17749/m.28354 type:complete len:248 (-) Transcript_17749:4-747(-)